MAININVSRDSASEYDAQLLLGVKGDTGKSAYQYAVEGGYQGTEAEFLAEMARLTSSADSAENSAQRAEDALSEFTEVTATATTLEAGADATAVYVDGELTFGIPRGEKGEQGDPYDDSVIQARMDTFTNLAEGSTTGDAELADGRVGANGVTYTNIGGAIRGQITDLKSDIDAVDDRTFALTTNNIINPADIEGKGVWWYNGVRYTSGTTATDSCRSAKIYVKPNTTYYFGVYTISTGQKRGNYGIIYFNPFKADGTFISGQSATSDFTTGGDWAYVIITYAAYDGDVLTYEPMCSEKVLPQDYEAYTPLTAEYILNRFIKTMFISSADNDTQLLLKMLEAFNEGNVDVFFEKATYTLSEAYVYMWDTLMWRWGNGLPVGNGCRYYFNDSVIISNPPANPPSGSNAERNILDCRARGTDYEVYDVTLINNGGRYCIHDEGNNSQIPYFHRYENVVMIYNKTELTPDTGAKAFGCGTGFDASLVFDGCVFVHNNGQDGGRISIHAPTTNPNNDPCKLHLIMKNSYIDRGTIFLTVFEEGRDTVDFFLFGNKFGSEFNDPIVNLIENNNTVIN